MNSSENHLITSHSSIIAAHSLSAGTITTQELFNGLLSLTHNKLCLGFSFGTPNPRLLVTDGSQLDPILSVKAELSIRST